MGYFLEESIYTMLSRLFAIEACYYQLPFCDVNYHFAGENREKPICFGVYFAGANYHFADSNRESRGKKVWIARIAIV